MTVSSAANAVLAKARAMYGKRLTAQNYTDLLACRSVNEAAAYLKAHTVYADAFEGVTMGSLRRWQIDCSGSIFQTTSLPFADMKNPSATAFINIS